MSIESSSEHLIWSPPSGIARVAISRKVAADIRHEVMRGFGVTKRRGTEQGGLLLGRTADHGEAHILVESFETVPCSYSEGPSYHLSEDDYALFEDALSKQASRWLPVGLWRSSTRETLELDKADLALMGRFFTGPLQAVLVVRPFATRPPEAKLFLFGAGQPVQGAFSEEFIFDAAAVPQAPPKLRKPAQAVAPAAPASAPEPIAVAPAVAEMQVPHLPATAPSMPETERILAHVLGPRTQRPESVDLPPAPELFSAYAARLESHPWHLRRVLSLVAFAVAMLGLGTLAGYQMGGGDSTLFGGRAAAKTQTPASSLLNLSAAAQDGDLQIRWNHRADILRAASRGVVYISDSGTTKDVVLSRGELLGGLLLYTRRGGEVQLQLELQLEGSRRISETVVWQGTVPAAAVP